MMLKNYFIIIE